MIFHWSDSKSLEVTRTLLSILADLSNAAFWRLLIRPQISNSSSPLWKPAGTVPSPPIAISTTVTLILQLSPFCGKVLVLVSCLAFFDFHFLLHWKGKIHLTATSLFCNSSLGLVFWLGLDDLLVSLYSSEFFTSYNLEQVLVCAHTIL